MNCYNIKEARLLFRRDYIVTGNARGTDLRHHSNFQKAGVLI
jgi:hypothetical protein